MLEESYIFCHLKLGISRIFITMFNRFRNNFISYSYITQTEKYPVAYIYDTYSDHCNYHNIL